MNPWLLVLISLASAAHGLDCPLDAHADVFKLNSNSCPRPGLDSNEKIFCCVDRETFSAHCCDPTEWAITTAGNAGIVITSSGYKTKLHQSSHVLFYLWFIRIVIGQLSL